MNSSAAPVRTPSNSGPCNRAPRFLVVDDEPVMRRTLKRMILKARPGWQIVSVATAEAALRELASRCFDVVMTDLRMPGMGGQALLEKLKLHHPGTAAVIYSAQIETHREHPASRLALLTLAKPASVEDLIGALDHALDSAQGLQRGQKNQAC